MLALMGRLMRLILLTKHGSTPYSVTRAINGLLKEGLIQAANDHATSRSKFVELSKAGIPIYQNIANYMAKRCEDVLDGISDEEQTITDDST